MVQENIEEVKKKAEKFETQYNKIKQEFKDYIETSKKNEEKKRLDIRSDFSKRLLMVADSLDRITGSGNASSCELMKGHMENIIKNIDAVYSQMLSASGLTAIEPIAGEKFDEQKHIAIGLEFGVKYPENTVFKVVRKGYLMENNVVRPAEVIISKNPILQHIAKPGLWDRLLRIINRNNNEKFDKLALDIKSQNERIDLIIKEIESLRTGLHENIAKPEKAKEPQQNQIIDEVDEIG